MAAMRAPWGSDDGSGARVAASSGDTLRGGSGPSCVPTAYGAEGRSSAAALQRAPSLGVYSLSSAVITAPGGGGSTYATSWMVHGTSGATEAAAADSFAALDSDDVVRGASPSLCASEWYLVFGYHLQSQLMSTPASAVSGRTIPHDSLCMEPISAWIWLPGQESELVVREVHQGGTPGGS